MIPRLGLLGPNFTTVTAGGVQYWFSYETCIAFQKQGEDMIISENIWGNTTGRHINYLGGKDNRTPRAQFVELLGDNNE